MLSKLDGIQIASHSLRSWEEETSFNAILYEWMSAAPWMLISAAAHLLLFFIAAAIPWSDLQPEERKGFVSENVTPIDEFFEKPEEEIIEEELEEPVEEPVLQDSKISESEDDPEYAEAEGDPEFLSDSPFNENMFNTLVGLGSGPGGKYGGRGLGGGGRKRGGKALELALQDGLEWLKNHQASDGSWDCDGFDLECGKLGSTRCGGAGYPEHDVGVTGLAVLAFMGMGSTTKKGTYKEIVNKGINYLKSQQDPDSGLIGDRASTEYIYNHVIATLAICENYYFSKSPSHKRVAQKAIDFITAARDPYGVWRYDVPSIGEGDTSVTGWMIFALASAKDAGLKIDTASFASTLNFFDDMTDTSNGRVGYLARGTGSSRIPGINDDYPVEKGEALTAVALLCRIFLEQDPSTEKVMEKHADLLLKTLPKWEPDENGCDMYYWYYGTYAMFQMGGHKSSYWKNWEKSIDAAVIKSQNRDGNEKGSWDPVGPWGYAGGRVYSTALMVLTLEVRFRYAKVLGAR
ncbi:MAG: hypothetical protein ACI8TQ_000978 [Planctomycetota bacterium]|jgi:hypothetical protein